MRLGLIFCLAASFPAAAWAQVPDPASVPLPSLESVSDPRVQKDGWKHFFFHKVGVSYAEAFSDFSDCYRFLGGMLPVGPEPLPASGAWSRAPSDGALKPQGTSYGLVGVAIGQIVAGPMQRRIRQSRLRRCMEPRGYVRFPLDEENWKLLIDNYSMRSIAAQAKLASGPRPAVAVVTQ